MGPDVDVERYANGLGRRYGASDLRLHPAGTDRKPPDPFKPWKEGFSYKDGSWSYYNEFYTPPTYLDCFIDPAVQSEEGGAAEEISNLKAYAFAADTAAWYIASYDDAVATIRSRAPTPTSRLTRRRVRRSIRCRFRPGR